ncbi:MAG: hypothetical protein JNM17_37110 [Archangium sp.]|nr:hypothetical protein [Archangium sp.]
MHVRWLAVLMLTVSFAALGAKTEAEKQQAKAEKKLEAFEKEYDPSKNLARKVAEIDKDIAALDKEIDALTALDAAAGAALKSKRDALVASAQQAVSGAAAGKASEAIDKKLERVAKDFDPEKKKLDSINPKDIERARKELDELISKLEGDLKTTYEGKRDELFKKIEGGVGDARTARRRERVAPVEPVAAIAGVDRIAPMKPTWCEGVLEARGKTMDSYFPGTPTEWTGRVTDVVVFSCVDPDWDVRQNIVAAWRQKMSNALGIDAATNERLVKLGAKMDLLQYASKKPLDRNYCDSIKPVTEGTAAERANRALERIALGCGNRLSAENAMRMIDIDGPGALTSQLATAGVVLRTLTETGEDPTLAAASDIAVLNTLPFDPATFETQLKALQLNEFGESAALIAYYGQRARLARGVALMKESSKKLPALTKLVFDAPSAAVKDYAARRAPADKPLLEQVLAFEAKSDALDGCGKQLWPFLQAELKSQGKAAVTDLNVSGLLAWALTECGRRDKETPMMEAVFSYWSERTTAVRGPLTAAYLAYVDAYNEVAAGQPKTSNDKTRERGGANLAPSIPAPRRNPLGEAELSDSRFGHENSLMPGQLRGGGVVKAIEKAGTDVKISFKVEKFMVPDLQCVETNRIDRITPEGQVIYRSQCTKIGEHEEQSTPEPILVPSWAAGGIVPGSYVSPMWGSSNGGAAGHAWILEAFDSKARGKRTSLLGIAQ